MQLKARGWGAGVEVGVGELEMVEVGLGVWDGDGEGVPGIDGVTELVGVAEGGQDIDRIITTPSVHKEHTLGGEPAIGVARDVFKKELPPPPAPI